MTRCIISGLVVTYLLAVAQTALGGRMAVRGVPPDLLFVWTVVIGLLSGRTAGALVGFGGGLLEGSLTQAWTSAMPSGLRTMVARPVAVGAMPPRTAGPRSRPPVAPGDCHAAPVAAGFHVASGSAQVRRRAKSS